MRLAAVTTMALGAAAMELPAESSFNNDVVLPVSGRRLQNGSRGHPDSSKTKEIHCVATISTPLTDDQNTIVAEKRPNDHRQVQHLPA